MEPNHGFLVRLCCDQLGREWCALVRAAVEKRIVKLPGFKPASRYDVLVPDDISTDLQESP